MNLLHADRSEVAPADWLAPLFGGKLVPTPSSEANDRYRSVEVATGRPFAEIDFADAGQVEDACAQASAAQKSWFALPYHERQAVFRAAAQVARQRRGDIVEIIMRESGSVEAKAAFETEVTIRLLDECAAIPSQAAGQVLPSSPGKISMARRRPLGVVAR